MSAFRNILRLSVGDFIAKTLNFLAFVYLARTLGVEGYGVLEFALSLLTYCLLFADGGLELWATREAASGADIRKLAARIAPLRFVLASGSFCVLLVLLFFLPNYPGLRTIMILFGLTLFVQAFNFKWVFMGQERMTRVAAGLVIAQIVFASAIFLVVHSPRAIIWVPVLRLVSDLAMAAYFAWLFVRTHGDLRLKFTLRNPGTALRPALTLGTSHGLAALNYNFDTIVIGFLLGPMMAGLYSAAYKPVTVMLAMPTTYFIGLFPALSRAHAQNRESFREIATRSFGLAALGAVPIGIGAFFLAAPIINFLFGPAYASAATVLQILSWSAVLVILRGTFRQSLTAAGKAGLDLRCAGASVLLNVILNLLLIPRYGIIGAAVATLISEVLWFSLAYYYFTRHISRLKLVQLLLQPIMAAFVMGLFLLLTQSWFWGARFVGGLAVYLGMLLLLGQKEVRSGLRLIRSQLPVAVQEQTTL
jgi:O-antigen/teichoic acid export membrane protein